MFDNFEQLMGHINVSEIEAEIMKVSEGEKELKPYEITEVKALIWLAGEKWLFRDLTEFTLTGTEVDILTLPDKNGYRFHAFIDVTGHVKGVKKPFDKFKGVPYCIDWKTTSKELDTKWRKRHEMSWQWGHYAQLIGAKLFIFRGVSRNESLTELILRVPETNAEEVTNFNNSISGQIKFLRDNKFKIWPQNKPYSCNAYGRTCEYYNDCDSYSMPKQVPPEKNLSYSYIKTFMECPEKARRNSLVIDEFESEETNIGKAFHRGISSLWQQGFTLQNKVD